MSDRLPPPPMELRPELPPDFATLDLDFTVHREGRKRERRVTVAARSAEGREDKCSAPWPALPLYEVRSGSAPSTADLDRQAREAGARLFETAFPGPLQHLLGREIDRLDDLGTGLRLRLRFDLKSPDEARLHGLPWELLYHDHRFLALRKNPPISIVRSPRILRTTRPPAALPLTVLVIAGAAPDLDLDQELGHVRALLEDQEGIARVATASSLEAAQGLMEEMEVHILHFMGHGRFDPGRREGELLLAWEDRPEWVPGRLLARRLGQQRSLQLVFLSACSGARAADSEPFDGVAGALIQQGVPAVLAMRSPIEDRAAIRFTREVYARLATGEPIDAAVAAGRQALDLQKLQSHHPELLPWSVPSLTLRSEDGRLFSARRAVGSRGPASAATAVGAGQPAIGERGAEGVDPAGRAGRRWPRWLLEALGALSAVVTLVLAFGSVDWGVPAALRPPPELGPTDRVVTQVYRERGNTIGLCNPGSDWGHVLFEEGRRHIESGAFTYVTIGGNRRSEVQISGDSFRSPRDGVAENNLSSLPDCELPPEVRSESRAVPLGSKVQRPEDWAASAVGAGEAAKPGAGDDPPDEPGKDEAAKNEPGKNEPGGDEPLPP